MHAVNARADDRPKLLDRRGLVGAVVLLSMALLCLGSLPWTMSGPEGVPRYAAGDAADAGYLPPIWVKPAPESFQKLTASLEAEAISDLAATHGISEPDVRVALPGDSSVALITDLRSAHDRPLLGTDILGRSMWARLLAGGGLSIGIGLAASLIAVLIGTLYGAIAGYAGGAIDSVMMRIVDVLFGLPYVLLVVLLAVAADGLMDRPAIRSWLEDAAIGRSAIEIVTLLIAIGGVSWLTLARVIRGEVLSLKTRPYIEAAKASGAGTWWIFTRHLLPALTGPIVVYATLTAPQAILQESFLSFLGIGVRPPLPSWGNLAAEGLGELNNHRSRWWLLLFPTLALGATLLSLNLVGESLRRALDPKAVGR
ncbi:MAG: ABC transporter permease [Planctomycetota bacterium]